VNDARPENFATQFELIADLAPDRPAVFCGNRSLTFGELDALAGQLASHLDALGIRDGDRVGIAARNSPDYLVALTGLFKMGGVPFNINYRYRAAEIRHLLAETRARGVIADAEFAGPVRAAAAGLPDCGALVMIGEAGFGPEVTAAPRHPRRERGDAEWLLFTGGTTGYPKAVRGSHSERLAAVRAMCGLDLGIDPAAGAEGLRQALAVDPYGPGGVIHLPAPPLMHGTGLYTALGSLAVAAPVVLLAGARMSGADLLDAVARHQVTDLTLVGDAFGLLLLDTLDAEPERAGRLHRLRRIRSVGATWSPPVKDRLLAHLDVVLMDTIASSEGGPYAMSRVDRTSPPAEHGTFVLAPGARLLGPDGRDVVPGSGAIGILAFPAAPGSGYDGHPESTAQAFRDIDGLRYSMPGDLARLDANGRLELLGRSSSVINTGGEKVYPGEVESTLLDHPAVRDAVVVGVPDPRWGSAVAAVVVVQEDSAAAGPAELAAFVSGRLASYKKPRRVVIVDEIQRLNTGKPDLAWAAAQFTRPEANAPQAGSARAADRTGPQIRGPRKGTR
jgi:acyl-CoA synthetase (AMP-forming)/AMP-acid ligase II